MSTVDQFAPLDVALANGWRLLPIEPEAAAEQAREILGKNGENRSALRLLGRALRRLGHDEEANQADQDAIKAASNEPALVGAAQAIQTGDLKRAEHLVRPYLKKHPDDPAGFRLLGEIAARLGLPADASKYLRTAIELAPGYASAHVKLANILYHQGNYRGSIEQLDQLLGLDPEQGSARMSKAASLVMIGDFREAARLYEQLLERNPDNAMAWINYAHVLNTIGRFDESVAAYRKSLELRPDQGDAWWSLANLKLSRFSPADVNLMFATLERAELDDKARTQLEFALGKALEDEGDFRRSFDHYARGNELRAAEQDYDPTSTSEMVARSQDVFDADYFSRRAMAGALATDPIFIVGLPRAGSTLVEQILASHSAIEGTAELPYIPGLRQRVSGKSGLPYPDCIAQIPAEHLRALGEGYLSDARAHRKTAKRYFIDKLPNNWQNVGLILSVLPNAKIVDARRHPMSCGFSNFKQLYARGQEFSYSLEWMGHYYADYVRLMRHFDELFPGRVHRVIHEQLIDNPEDEIRALLDHIGVPFEESCLRFYENERPVRTPSAGQVRQPLNRRGIDQWRNFEPWLDELKAALGPVLTAYPDVPDRSALP